MKAAGIVCICLLFPGMCNGGLINTVTGLVNGILSGVTTVVSGVVNALNPTGTATTSNPLVTTLGGIINNVTSVVCNILYQQFPLINGNPSARIESGTVVGRYVNIEGISLVASFLRIPYATPPLGNLRFKRAQKIAPWNGVYQANLKAPPCIQSSSNGNASWQSPYPPTEDCLVLNVYVPKRCVDTGKLPVLVWIHGGSFFIGSSAIYDGSLIALLGQVVVVTMNYRLGVFGFLKADPTEAPGNMGLTDQVLAMQWVKTNIAAFGGDPNNVMLFGESGGAQSVSLHMVSPLSRGLFQKALMESGSMYTFTFTDSPQMSKNKTGEVAEEVGCSIANLDTDPVGVVNCLRGIDAMTLSAMENSLRPHLGLFSQPSVGDAFLPVHPMAAYDAGNIAPVNVLIGNLKDEATLFLNLGLPSDFPFTSEPNLNLTYAKSLLPIIFELLPSYMQQQVSDYYLSNIAENDSPAIVEAIKFALGDLAFFCPAHFLSEKVQVAYAYWWTYLTSKTPNSNWVGVFHGSDVPYVYGFPLISMDQYTVGDAAFSAYIVQEWVNFAKTNAPIESFNPVTGLGWKPFNPQSPTTFEIAGILNSNIPFPRQQACDTFWRPIFDNYTNYVSPIWN